MNGKRKTIKRDVPTLTPRDFDLVKRFLEKHRDDFLKAYLTARESANIAPGLTQYRGMMAHRKNQISAIDYMLSHLGDRLEFLTLIEGYDQQETE